MRRCLPVQPVFDVRATLKRPTCQGVLYVADKHGACRGAAVQRPPALCRRQHGLVRILRDGVVVLQSVAASRVADLWSARSDGGGGEVAHARMPALHAHKNAHRKEHKLRGLGG